MFCIEGTECVNKNIFTVSIYMLLVLEGRMCNEYQIWNQISCDNCNFWEPET